MIFLEVFYFNDICHVVGAFSKDYAAGIISFFEFRKEVDSDLIRNFFVFREDEWVIRLALQIARQAVADCGPEDAAGDAGFCAVIECYQCRKRAVVVEFLHLKKCFWL